MISLLGLFAHTNDFCTLIGREMVRLRVHARLKIESKSTGIERLGTPSEIPQGAIQPGPISAQNRDRMGK